nr:hypothetical protein [Desulfobacterales bacterium]
MVCPGKACKGSAHWPRDGVETQPILVVVLGLVNAYIHPIGVVITRVALPDGVPVRFGNGLKIRVKEPGNILHPFPFKQIDDMAEGSDISFRTVRFDRVTEARCFASAITYTRPWPPVSIHSHGKGYHHRLAETFELICRLCQIGAKSNIPETAITFMIYEYS